jgi:hypothetical protein
MANAFGSPQQLAVSPSSAILPLVTVPLEQKVDDLYLVDTNLVVDEKTDLDAALKEVGILIPRRLGELADSLFTPRKLPELSATPSLIELLGMFDYKFDFGPYKQEDIKVIAQTGFLLWFKSVRTRIGSLHNGFLAHGYRCGKPYLHIRLLLDKDKNAQEQVSITVVMLIEKNDVEKCSLRFDVSGSYKQGDPVQAAGVPVKRVKIEKLQIKMVASRPVDMKPDNVAFQYNTQIKSVLQLKSEELIAILAREHIVSSAINWGVWYKFFGLSGKKNLVNSLSGVINFLPQDALGTVADYADELLPGGRQGSWGRVFNAMFNPINDSAGLFLFNQVVAERFNKVLDRYQIQ